MREHFYTWDYRSSTGDKFEYGNISAAYAPLDEIWLGSLFSVRHFSKEIRRHPLIVTRSDLILRPATHETLREHQQTERYISFGSPC